MRGTNSHTRRSFMLAIASAYAAGAASAGATEIAESPILRLYREHQRLSAAAMALDPKGTLFSDAEMDRLFYDERDRVEAEMMALPSVTAADMAAKMIIAHCDGDFTCLHYDSDPVWVEARALVGELSATKEHDHA